MIASITIVGRKDSFVSFRYPSAMEKRKEGSEVQRL